MRRIQLRGSRILVTGASSGIGRALAVRLAAQGARLAVAARREPELRALADEIDASAHPVPHVLATDLSRRGAATELATRAGDALGGGIDVLINNAGVGLIDSQVFRGDDDTVRAALETNFWSPLALAAAVVPGMLQQGRGAIVNVTSTVQSVPLPMVGYYGAAKAGLAQATRSLRHELRHTPIQVLEVVPGSTDTALRDIDLLPWRGAPPRLLRPVPPGSVAAATVRALQRGKRRTVHPAYSRFPLELPAIGRAIAAVAARRIDTTQAVRPAARG